MERRILRAQVDAKVESLIHHHPELRDLLHQKDDEIVTLRREIRRLLEAKQR